MSDDTPEVWEPVPEFGHYIVSSHGRVFNRRTQRYLKGSIDKSGPRKVNLSDVDRNKTLSVFSLVGRVFHPDYVEGVKLRPFDGDWENAHIDNIDLVDWMAREPRTTEVEHYPWAKRARVVEWDKEYDTVRMMADDVGGDLSTIYRCLRGEQKTHLGLTFEYVD